MPWPVLPEIPLLYTWVNITKQHLWLAPAQSWFARRDMAEEPAQIGLAITGATGAVGGRIASRLTQLGMARN